MELVGDGVQMALRSKTSIGNLDILVKQTLGYKTLNPQNRKLHRRGCPVGDPIITNKSLFQQGKHIIGEHGFLTAEKEVFLYKQSA